MHNWQYETFLVCGLGLNVFRNLSYYMVYTCQVVQHHQYYNEIEYTVYDLANMVLTNTCSSIKLYPERSREVTLTELSPL